MTWPFENDTRKVEQNFARKSLDANKQRNLLTGIIIFAAALLLTFSAILICNATIDTQIIAHVNNTGEMVRVILGIAVVLLFTAGIAIKNIMYISVLQRTRQFAQLRTVGATYRQIKAVIHNERKQLSLKFTVSGVLLGILCNLLLPLRFYWLPGILCALLAGGFVWFLAFLSFRAPARLAASLSPIAALNATPVSCSQTGRKHMPVTPRRLARKYFFSNRKKAGYTLLSLTLSGVIMFVVFSVISAVQVEELVRQSYYENSSVYLILNTTAEEDSTYNLMKNSPFTDSLQEKIKNIPGVTGMNPSKIIQNCKIAVPNQASGETIEWTLNSIVGPSTFASSLVEGEMPFKQTVDGVIPVVINRASFYYEKYGLHLKTGDKLTASIPDGKSVKEVIFSVCGFIENKDKGSVLYTASQYLDALTEINCTLAWYIGTKDAQTKAAVQQIKELVSSDQRITVSVFADDLAEYQAIFHNAKVAVIVAAVLLCLFSFINLLNTCITNTVMRHHDYALLEAAGMTKAQLQQTQSAENRIYFLGSLLGSCIGGLPFGYLLCHKISQVPGLSYISYKFPWGFVIAYAFFVFAVHTTVTVYQKHILMKYSVVERIRNTD